MRRHPPATLEAIPVHDDGVFPNSSLPVLMYKNVPSHTEGEWREILKQRGWRVNWVNGIYSYHHYHSTAHELLITLSGTAKVKLGGPTGRALVVEAGHALVLPAGVAHCALETTTDFCILGAYPNGQEWNILKGEPGDREKGLRQLREVTLPDADPLLTGEDGLLQRWHLT